MNLYKEELLDHYKNPRNYEVLNSPDFTSGQHNPSCGDSVEIYGQITGNLISKISFTGKGCVLSQAAASMLTEKCLNMSLEDILKLDQNFILEMVGIPLGPNRIKCVLLPLIALQNGIKDYKNSKIL